MPAAHWSLQHRRREVSGAYKPHRRVLAVATAKNGIKLSAKIRRPTRAYGPVTDNRRYKP